MRTSSPEHGGRLRPAFGEEEQVRRTAGRTGAAGLALAVGLIAALGGCAAPEYKYVGSDDRDLVLRMPRTWKPVDTAAALKATGTDPTTLSGWTAFYDGSPKPAIAHVQAQSTDDPQLYAQTIAVGADQRAQVTDEGLLELMLPGTPELRAAAEKAQDFAMISKETVTGKRQHGVHVTYSVKVESKLEVYDRIALTDPRRKAVHVVFVHCTQQCFRQHPEIDDVVTSLTLKSR